MSTMRILEETFPADDTSLIAMQIAVTMVAKGHRLDACNCDARLEDGGKEKRTQMMQDFIEATGWKGSLEEFCEKHKDLGVSCSSDGHAHFGWHNDRLCRKLHSLINAWTFQIHARKVQENLEMLLEEK